MSYQVFVSPQGKRCAIITYKHGIYGLSHELPKDLKLRNLAAGGAVAHTRKKKKRLRNLGN